LSVVANLRSSFQRDDEVDVEDRLVMAADLISEPLDDQKQDFFFL
jgi:hypothetical protein